MALARLKRKLTTENLWMYILSLLKERPMYAYELNKLLRERFNLSPSTVTVYLVLYRMVREGLIEKASKISVDGKPERTYYKATEKGLETLEEGLKFIKNVLKAVEAHRLLLNM